MFNKILLTHIQKDKNCIKPMTVDDLENPSSYKGLIYPLRYLLAIRYLKQKQKVLEWFRFNKIYPVPEDDYKNALIQQLSNKKSHQVNQQEEHKTPLVSVGFKAALVYPILLLVLGVGAYSVNNWYQLKVIENALANHLPYYSDLLHRKLMLKHNGSQAQRDNVDAAIEKEGEKILTDLPEKGGVRDVIAKQMERLKDSSTSIEEIMLGFKDVNTLFDKQGLPFYLTPKSFAMTCSSLIDASVEEMMLLKKLEEFMSGGKPELCRTTMMTAYRVTQRGQLYYTENKKETELPLFQVKRVDKVPAVDSALGLTFKHRGIGSIILMDQIKNFGEESVLPALTFQGRNYIIPYWMQGYYEIEEAVTKGYKKDLHEIYPKKTERIKVKTAVKKIIKNKNRMQNAKMQQTLQRPNDNSDSDLFGGSFDAISVLLGKQRPKNKKQQALVLDDDAKEALKKLNAVLLPSIEFHEAYHQIVKKKWKQPSWVKSTFKDKLSEDGIEHTLEELGAYLSQLANTKQGHNIWLSKLLIFSLNPMTKGQAEDYASTIILNAIEDLDTGQDVQPKYSASVEEKTEIYKKFSHYSSDEMRTLMKTVYEILFERDVPVLYE